MFIDSHCHLDHLDLSHYPDGLSGALVAARELGVNKFLSVAVSLESSRNLQQLAADFDDVHISAGVHPLQKKLPALPELSELLELGAHDAVVAIGETGLDYYYSADSAEWQRESFKRHLLAAKELSKPLIVHTRDAREETLDYIGEFGDPEVGGVLHCFTESAEMALQAIEMGYYISFSGITTFRNADELRAVVKAVPLERMLIETDSPWLAPVPHRGKQNEPKYVVEVAKCIADLKAVSVEQVGEQTSQNFAQLFLA